MKITKNVSRPAAVPPVDRKTFLPSLIIKKHKLKCVCGYCVGGPFGFQPVHFPARPIKTLKENVQPENNNNNDNNNTT